MDSSGDHDNLPDTERDRDGFAGAGDAFTDAGGAMDARLARLLKGAPEADPAGPLPDPSRVASHFAGVGDQALLEDAAARPSVRRLLAEVAEDAAAAEAEFAVARAAASAKGHVPARPDEGTLSTALAAFDASLRAPSVFETSGSERSDSEAATGIDGTGTDAAPEWTVLAGGRARRRGFAWAAAAALLVAVPIGLASRSAQAGPVLALAGVDRLDAAGALAAEGPRRAGVGDRFDPASGERVSLRMPGGARVVLTSGGAHVAEAGKDALLALDRGEAVLAAGQPTDSRRGARARLRLPDGAVVEALAGAAHVAVRADGATAIDVRGGGLVRWTPATGGGLAGGGGSVAGGDSAETTGASELAGPAAFLLPRGARTVPARESLRKDAEALFRDLQFFGGDFVPAFSERWTTARFWRVLGGVGPAATRVSDSDGVPALRFDLPVSSSAPSSAPGGSAKEVPEARIAWRPDAEALSGARLLVLVRARPAPAGAGGLPDPDALPARVAVVLLDADGEEVARDEVAATQVSTSQGPTSPATDRGEEPPARVELVLPPDFASRASKGELVLSFRGVAASSIVWFTGASFRPNRERGTDGSTALRAE